MKCRIFATLLALTMALAAFPVTAFAAESISLNKTGYISGEHITVTVSGITEEMEKTKPYVAIYSRGAAANKYSSEWYAVKKGTNAYTFTKTNLAGGEYEMRLYRKIYATEADFITSAAFTVVDDPSNSIPTNTLPGADLNAVGNYDWSGVWDETNYGELTIVRDGDRVTGNYPHDKGRITATAKGNMLFGQWAEAPNYAPPNDGGDFEFVMSEDGRSFVGHSRYGSNTNWRSWNGKRTSAAPPSETPPAEQPTVPSEQGASFTAAAVESGVKFDWVAYSGNMGYRVFRSAVQGQQGVSITDFALGGTSFVDVNVDPNTTYYYSLYAVIKEATSGGEREQLSHILGAATVKTGSVILGGGFSANGGRHKSIILMKMNDPYMSVNGVRREVDPGRNTTPMLISSRTMVPIRAVIEGMGGTVGWDDAAQRITLDALGHKVTMWLNKRDLTVDGANKTMDVAPQSVNGRTMVPVRFAAENVGCAVDWIASTNEIVIVFSAEGNGGAEPAPPEAQAPPMEQAPPEAPAPPTNGSLTMDIIKQTAKSMGYETFDSIGFGAASGAAEPADGTNIIRDSVTHVGVMEFPDAAQARKYADYFNGLKAQYASTYAKYRAFSYERFYFQIEDYGSNAGKDVLTALVPNWEGLLK